MTDKVTNLKLNVSVDQSLAAQGVKALKDIQNAIDTLSASFQKISVDVNATNELHDQTLKAADALDSATSAADANAHAIENLRDQYIQAADAAEKAQAEFEAAANAYDDAQSGAANGSGSGGGLLGNINGLRRTGSSLTGLGLGEIGVPVQKVGELGQVIKELGVVSDAAGASEVGMAAALAPIAVAAGAAVV